MTDLEEAISPCFGPPCSGPPAEILAERLLTRTRREVAEDIVLGDLRAIARGYGLAPDGETDPYRDFAADGGAEAVALAQMLAQARTDRARRGFALSSLIATAMAMTAIIAVLTLLLV